MPEKRTVMDLEKIGISNLRKEDTFLPFSFIIICFYLTFVNYFYAKSIDIYVTKWWSFNIFSFFGFIVT